MNKCSMILILLCIGCRSNDSPRNQADLVASSGVMSSEEYRKIENLNDILGKGQQIDAKELTVIVDKMNVLGNVNKDNLTLYLAYSPLLANSSQSVASKSDSYFRIGKKMTDYKGEPETIRSMGLNIISKSKKSEWRNIAEGLTNDSSDLVRTTATRLLK